jgi:hypothetical protein
MHSSTSMHFNMHVLKSKYVQLTVEFDAIGLRLEPAKTELMHFTAHLLSERGKPLYSCPYPEMDLGVQPFTGGKRLKPSILWRYVGFFFDSNLSFSSHVDFYVNKAYSTARALCMLGNSVKGLDCHNRALVYKVAVFPILTYGAALYWKLGGAGVRTLLYKLRKVQNYAARWTIGAFWTTPGGAVTIIAGLPPLAAMLDELLDGTHCRWQNLPPTHGVSLVLNAPRMAFLDTHRIPTTLRQTRQGWIPAPVAPRKSRTDHTATSPLIRAKVEEWKADFPTDWEASLRNELPPNVKWRNRDWHGALEDVGDYVETESVGRDVYVVLVAVDQRLEKNPRGHGILARLGSVTSRLIDDHKGQSNQGACH